MEILWKDAQDKIYEKPTLLVFKTSWCPDCKMMGLLINNILSELKQEGISNFNYFEVDAEEANLFRNENSSWKVLKVPSFYLINGQKTEHLGYEFIPEDVIKNAIITNLS